jgi:hypothetical protein
LTNLPLEDIKLGVVYAKKPKLVPLVVFYDLRNIKLSEFPEITMQYGMLGPNQTKVGIKPEDFLKPDTVMVDTENITLTPSKSNISNKKINFLLRGNRYAHEFTVANFCDTARTIITF